METIEPRLFLVLPEHDSNANHVWNCALFLTQISHLYNNTNSANNNTNNSNTNSNSSLSSLAHHQSALGNETNDAPTSNRKLNTLEAVLKDLGAKVVLSNAHSSSINSNHIYETLADEAMARMLKTKPKNKASLFNLVLDRYFKLDADRNARRSFDTPWLQQTLSEPDFSTSEHEERERERENEADNLANSNDDPTMNNESDDSESTDHKTRLAEQNENCASSNGPVKESDAFDDAHAIDSDVALKR